MSMADLGNALSILPTAINLLTEKKKAFKPLELYETLQTPSQRIRKRRALLPTPKRSVNHSRSGYQKLQSK